MTLYPQNINRMLREKIIKKLIKKMWKLKVIFSRSFGRGKDNGIM